VLSRPLFLDLLTQEEQEQRQRNWEQEQESHLRTIEEHERLLAQYLADEARAREKIDQHKREYHERLEWENRERVRLRLYWKDFDPVGQCLGVGKRIHSARLENYDQSIDGVLACRETLAVINGVEYPRPMRCEDRGSEIRGYWMVTNDEVCASYWEYFREKGCSNPGSGHRRYESHLGGVRPSDNPEAMCFSTPATIQGKHYDGPMSCPDWGQWGWWGIWDIPDENCR